MFQDPFLILVALACLAVVIVLIIVHDGLANL